MASFFFFFFFFLLISHKWASQKFTHPGIWQHIMAVKSGENKHRQLLYTILLPDFYCDVIVTLKAWDGAVHCLHPVCFHWPAKHCLHTICSEYFSSGWWPWMLAARGKYWRITGTMQRPLFSRFLRFHFLSKTVKGHLPLFYTLFHFLLQRQTPSPLHVCFDREE